MPHARRRFFLGLSLAVCLTAPAAAGELDGIVFLSWSPDAQVSTLELSSPGSVDCWLLVRTDLAPARFIEAVGDWVFGPGLVPTGFEVLTSGTPVGVIAPGQHGVARVMVGDFDCARPGDPLAVARITLDVDPEAFSFGRAAVTPVADETRLTFADYDPVMTCLGVWDVATIPPLEVLDPTVPAERSSFSAVKASYR